MSEPTLHAQVETYMQRHALTPEQRTELHTLFTTFFATVCATCTTRATTALHIEEPFPKELTSFLRASPHKAPEVVRLAAETLRERALEELNALAKTSWGELQNTQNTKKTASPRQDRPHPTRR